MQSQVYRCIGIKYIQSIINEIIWVEENLQSGVEDILNEIIGFLSIIIQIIFFLSIPYVLFIKPAYQRMVLKKEWWQILGHAKSDQDETEWTVRFQSLNAWYPIHPYTKQTVAKLMDSNTTVTLLHNRQYGYLPRPIMIWLIYNGLHLYP